jgi:glycosyltransferase involved in cell wall biosynthesis
MVIISNGFSKFHLSVAAAEAYKRQLLSSFITGAYPTPLIRAVLALPLLRTNSKVQRLGARREAIPDDLVHSLVMSDAVYAFGIFRHRQSTIVNSLRLYGLSAKGHVRQAAARGARIYHYRAGFGGESVEVAKKSGMFTLCDHSAVHPRLFEYLAENKGTMPRCTDELSIGPFWKYVLEDLKRADAVLVNSHFTEETFRQVSDGTPPVRTIFLGVDDSFLDRIPERKDARDEFCLLFAGAFQKAKGVETLIEAFEHLDHLPIRLEIAGPIGQDMLDRSRSFFSNSRVKYLGQLSRPDLASAMSRADAFVFPSFTEGSARVVFEALACGCYVITTPNSGSIVEDGIHGRIVAPGESALLVEAIEDASRNRDKVAEIGRQNALCVKGQYRQRNYGNNLSLLYRNLLEKKENHPAVYG